MQGIMGFNVGALIIRVGFWGYTITIIRSPQSPIPILSPYPTLGKLLRNTCGIGDTGMRRGMEGLRFGFRGLGVWYFDVFRVMFPC